MKVLSSIFACLFLLAVAVTTHAQLANTYSYSTTTGGVIDPMTGSTNLLTAPNDDGPSALTTFPGGFSFTYEGLSYTQFSVTPDGFLKLGSPVTTSQFTNSITSTANRPKIFALWDDLALGSAAGGGKVHYLMTGSSPTRIFIVEWFVTIPRATSGAANSRFQVWLYEDGGRIDFVYGAGGNPSGASIGINSVAANPTNFQSVTSSTHTVSTVTANDANTTNPGSGRVYTFAPPTAQPNDVGVISSSLSNIKIYSVGKGYDFTATVKNFGTNTQNVVDVYYSVNGAPPMGPISTVGPIVSGGTESVSFSGGNAFAPITPGNNVIKIYTSLATDGNATNDTLTTVVFVADKITTYPHVETFGSPTGWTILTEKVVGTTQLWGLVFGGTIQNPDGVLGDTVAKSNFYLGTAGRTEVLRSPELDLSGTTNPVLNFYVAYRTYTANEDDSLQVVISTDGGVTFFDASTVYRKGESSIPSLATRPGQSASYTPGAPSEWRHETIDLSNVAGMSNVVVGFRAIARFGNNLYIDNFIVSDVNGLCNDNVTALGSYNCNSLVTLTFSAMPVPSGIGLQNDSKISSVKSDVSDTKVISGIPSFSGEVKVIPTQNNDNPSGGNAYVSQYTGNNPGQNVAINSTATTQNGSIFTPTNVYHDYWFRTTYTGNDKTGYATYDIAIDLTGLTFIDPSMLYIVKRTDQTGNWVCLNTTVSGNSLVATGLTTFSDFAIAGQEPLPVELSSFTSVIDRRDVTLNWTTASETNNSGFEIERSTVNGSWSKIGFVSGNGTSTTPHSYSFVDRGLNSGKYNYRLKQVDFNGNHEYFNLNNEVNVGIPVKFDLSQNYPNPFNPSTKINFDLPYDSKVNIKLFDMSGREVGTLVNEVRTAGYYTVDFNASNLSSGVYFYRISAEGSGNNFTMTKKMMLVK